jgi:diguanylate cyclase (GGDEF)-like protein
MGVGFPRFSLLAKFSLLTLLCVVVLGTALFLFLRSEIRDRAREDARRQAEHLATDFGIEVSDRELEAGLTRSTSDELDRAVRGHRAAGELQDVKILDRRGRLVYEFDHERLDEDGGDLVEDVPLRFPGNAQPQGVVQVHLPYAPVAAQISHDTRRLVPILLGGLALLCLMLVPIVSRASRALRRQARYDDLTGVANRRRLFERLELEIGRERSFGLLMLDLDRFRDVNDALGHVHGDTLLREVAARLQRTIRPCDLIARLGGDEFALLIVDVGGPEAAMEIAERISQALHQDFVVGEVPLYLEASMGIAIHPRHGRSAEALVQAADIAMYASKTSGTGPELYLPERDRRGPDRVARLSELRRAIDQGELVLHYQPKVDLRTNRVPAVEALMRWNHPERGLIAPAQFLPLAEQTGLIVPLTSFALDAALGQCRAWADEGLDVQVAVNVSERSLLDCEFPFEVAALLARSALPDDPLQLELTERSLICDLAVAGDVVGRLHELGVRLSVDDFGTGYSSFSRLRDLHIDELKIDRSFVTDMAQDGQGLAIVRSAIDLAHNLGLDVVAEGVERPETLAELRELGCDAAQGFLLGRPVPAEELTARLRSPSQVDPERMRGRA